MESYYEVNVAYKGRHLFATAPRSILQKEQCKIIMALFKTKFPAEDGYEVSATYWDCKGKSVR